jgi:hypothetical protein
MTKASDNVYPRFLISEGGSTSTPAANNVTVYAKADGLLYSKDDAGVETLVSGGAGGLSDHNHTGGGDGGDLDAPIIDGYAIWNEESAPSTPASATVAVYAKADGLMYSKDDAGVETLMSGGAGGGGASLLGITAYQGSGGDVTYTTTSTAFVDVDATNLAVTFTAPASGNILVRFTVPSASNSVGDGVFFNVRESTTNIGAQLVLSTTVIASVTATVYVTGVSAGSHTYKMGWRTTSGTGTIYYGNTTRGRIVIEVWAAP